MWWCASIRNTGLLTPFLQWQDYEAQTCLVVVEERAVGCAREQGVLPQQSAAYRTFQNPPSFD